MAQRHLYILRHGQTDYNLNRKIQGRGINAPLNETGRWQASQVAEVLREKPIERLYSSGMDRAIQTANIIGEVKGLDNSPHKELDEMDFGRLEGLDYNDDQVELQWLIQEWSKGNGQARTTGGESAIEVFERANTKFQELLAGADPDESLAFVLHGRLIRILMSQWMGLGYEGMSLFAHHNACINYLKWAPEPVDEGQDGAEKNDFTQPNEAWHGEIQPSEARHGEIQPGEAPEGIPSQIYSDAFGHFEVVFLNEHAHAIPPEDGGSSEARR
ncbi:MAG: histidine phosphatase family protein [Balneolaceae bacterium]|nr:histidine phosphatase family protein [Balneolaceae bacterium]